MAYRRVVGRQNATRHKDDTLPFSENKSPEGCWAGDSFGAVARDVQLVSAAG